MLPHYSPFKVAEVFSDPRRPVPRPDRPRDRPCRGYRPRDDLRAPARPPPAPARGLPRPGDRAARVPGGRIPARPPVRAAGAAARGPGPPGASGFSVPRPRARAWAAELGLPYSVADFINPGSSRSALLYRERFSPSGRLGRPGRMVAVGAICAETDEEAERLAASWQMAIGLAGRGQFGPVPAVARALEFLAGRRRRGQVRRSARRRRLPREGPAGARADRVPSTVPTS